MSATAAARLRRLLNVLPLLADDVERPVEEALRQSGTDARTLLADLVAISQRYDLSGDFDEGVQIMYDERTVTVHAPRFRRPPRVTRAELTAIELGLAVLRRERPPEEWPVIDRALARLCEVVVKLPASDAYETGFAADVRPARSPATLAVLRRGLRRRRTVKLQYQGSQDREPSERTIHPYGFVFASGMWYIVANCERAGGVRIFRSDRIAGATDGDGTFEPPSGFSVNEFVAQHRAFDGAGSIAMKVRYSPAIARWIAEREGRDLDADGSLTMEHPVADRAWALRHVLQYGPEAEVLEPPEVRWALAQLTVDS